MCISYVYTYIELAQHVITIFKAFEDSISEWFKFVSSTVISTVLNIECYQKWFICECIHYYFRAQSSKYFGGKDNVNFIFIKLNFMKRLVYKIFYCLANSSGRDFLRNYLFSSILVPSCASGEAIYLSSMKNLLRESILLILTSWKIGPDLRKLCFIFSRWGANVTNTT